LSGNYLENIVIELDRAVSLKSLHLEDNRIKYLNKSFRDNLKLRKNNILEIFLTGNYLSCGCSENGLDTIEFIQQAQRWNITFHLSCSDNEFSFHAINLFDVNKKRFPTRQNTKTQLL
jgi:hypothetical protein